MSAGRPREFDPDQCLDAAMTEFWSRGYDATGMRDLAAAMNIGRQSLYNTFGDKRQVFLAAVRRYGQHRAARCQELLAEAGSPLAAVRMLLQKAGEPAECRGCMVTNVLPQFLGSGDEIEHALKDEMHSPERVLTDWLELAKKKGELREDADPEYLAQSLSTLIIGVIMQTSLAGEMASERHKAAVDMAERTLAEYLP